MMELMLAEMMEEQRNYKLVFPAADQENEEKVVDVAKQEQKMAKEFGTTNPEDKAEENCTEKQGSMEGACSSMTKELLLTEDKCDLLALATQDVVFNCSKACEIKTKSIEVEEGKQGKVKVRICGGLEECLMEKGEFGFKYQVKEHITMLKQEVKCAAMKLKQEVKCVTKNRMEVMQMDEEVQSMEQGKQEVVTESLERDEIRPTTVPEKEVLLCMLLNSRSWLLDDTKVLAMCCRLDPYFSELELLLAWFMAMLQKAERLRLASRAAYCVKSQQQLVSDYG